MAFGAVRGAFNWFSNMAVRLGYDGLCCDPPCVVGRYPPYETYCVVDEYPFEGVMLEYPLVHGAL